MHSFQFATSFLMRTDVVYIYHEIFTFASFRFDTYNVRIFIFIMIEILLVHPTVSAAFSNF